MSESAGGFFGSYGSNRPVFAFLNTKLTAAGVLHWASCGGPRPTGTTVGEVPLFCGGFWVLHTHGCTCGPEKIGPPIGWLVIVMRARRPSGSAAVSSLGPSARPVTRPVRRPPPASENALA